MALKIKPSVELLEFIKSIPETADVPFNLSQPQLAIENVLLTNADVRWLGNYTQKVCTECKNMYKIVLNSSIELK